MSDDSKKTPASLSASQPTASLDDVLASLEQQTASLSIAPVAAMSQPTIEEVKKVEPVETAQATISEPIVAPPGNTPFQIAETHIEPQAEIKAPMAEKISSLEHVQDKPVVSIQESPSQVAPTPTPAPPPKSGGMFSFLNPKFAVGALVVAVMAVGIVAAYVANQAAPGTVDNRQLATGCKITYNGTSSFSVTNCQGKPILRFRGPTCPTTQTKVGEEQVPTSGTHSYTTNPPAGQCEQVDHNFGDDFGTPGGGVCTCAPAEKKACGDSCVSDSDCRNPSTAGIPVVCRAGKCENSACPAGQTQPGANCSCNAGRSCGQSCGASVGLCTDGKSTCGFITPPNQCAQNEGNTAKQFCIPTSPYGGYTTTACVGIFTIALVKPNGTAATTQQDVITACTPPVATPTPTPRITPTPTPVITPTPSPTPVVTVPPLACFRITKDVATPVIGSQVRFTCGTVANATNYEFRYKYAFNGGQDVIGTLGANGNVSVPLIISQPARYKVQCRPCIGQACSQWEAW